MLLQMVCWALEMLRGVDSLPLIDDPLIIILDLNMPRMNGLQFLQELRSDPDLHKLIVFVLTTSKDDQDRSKAYSNHIAGFIAKSDFDTSFLDAVAMLESYWKIYRISIASYIAQLINRLYLKGIPCSS
jgi:CheY-like chemotaxis protein